MVKFKMPPHPIYRDNKYIATQEMFIEAKHRGNETRTDNQTVELLLKDAHTLAERNGDTELRFSFSDVYTSCVTKRKIAESGHVLLKIDESHWDETLSAKTLDTLQPSEIKLPYDAFAIDLSSASWNMGYDYVFMSYMDTDGPNDTIVIRLENNKEGSYFAVSYHDNAQANRIRESHHEVATSSASELAEFNAKIFSIILYCTTFKRERNRVDVREVKTRNTPGVAKYRMKEVRLIQPEYALHGKEKGKRGKGISYHIVRGHWRLQPIGSREEGRTKLVWIAPFWKGETAIGQSAPVRIVNL